MEILVLLFGGISFLAGIGSLVCWVMSIIKAFQNEESPLLGILSIVLCSLGGFVIGWIFHKKWNHRGVMLTWTACFAVAMIFWLATFAVLFAIGAAEQGQF